MSVTCLAPMYSDSFAAECSTSRSVGGMAAALADSGRLAAVTAAMDKAPISKAT